MKGYPVFWNSQRICNVCNASITSQITEYHSCPTTVAAGHHFPPGTAMFKLSKNLWQSPEVQKLIDDETYQQFSGLELIASENLTPLAVMQANGSILTNKYSEGLPRA
ncbi:hypothetical protein BY996DRAFT_6425755 [Phakopsora pachyrhizi]|nr:hypothetical protein BY996DRAFT_6425755 [Phakopsora pachyrhizi]